MSLFEDAFPTILKNEGGFVDDKNDAGGATNRGVSLRYLKSLGDLEFDLDRDGDIDRDDIFKLSIEDAFKIYKEYWWDKFGYDRITDQSIATKLLDMSINMGQKQAVKILQCACVRYGVNGNLACDGVLGANTINIVNSTDSIKLLNYIRSECAVFYMNLIKKNPKLARYKNGWIKRGYS